MKLNEALAAFLANSPRLIQGAELYGWNGLEGVGYIAEFNEAEAVVMDITETEIAVEHHNFDADTIEMWRLTVNTIKMHVISPVPNLNGSKEGDLIEHCMNVRTELLWAVQLMLTCLPHPRDYQTGGDYQADRAEAERRVAVVQSLAEAYYRDAIAVAEASK